MALTACLAWAMPAAAQQLLFHFPLDGTASVAGSGAGDSRLYLVDGGPAPTTVPGKIGSALHFTGKAAIAMPFRLDHVTYPQVTVTAWVRLDPDVTGDRTVFSAGNGNVPKLMINGSRNIFTAARGTLQAAAPIPPGEWVFVAGTVDVAAARIEVVQADAVLAREGITVSNLYPPSSYRNPDDSSLPATPYVFVGSHGFNQWRANGMAIDDVRVYAGVLSAEQVAALRDAGASGAEPTPSLASAGLPQSAPGTESLFQNDTPNIAAEDRPPGPLDLTVDADGEGTDVPLLDAPPPPPDPVDEIACESASSSSRPSFSMNGEFPERFVAALRKAMDCRLPVKVATLNLSGDWILSTDDQLAHSRGIPATLAAALGRFEREHGGLDAADIAESGDWMIVSGSSFEHQGLPSRARDRVAQALASGRRIISFDFDPGSNGLWAMVDSAGTVSGQDLPHALLNVLEDLVTTKRQPHHVRLSANGGWALLTSDEWFATAGVHDGVLHALRVMQRSGKRTDHIVLNETRGQYIVYGAGAEPTRSADPVYLVEHQIGGANIWSRMRAHNLAGVSIAMIRDNRIAWARGYGLRNRDEPESYLRADTTFDAASISKPIASFGLLQLVAAGKMSLTAEGVLQDLEPLFKNFGRPEFRKAVRPEASNLIQLLQHCASICYDQTPYCTNGGKGGGAAEYAIRDTLPSLPQMIRGAGPAKPYNKLVRTGNPGVRSVYTSANFMLVQALIEVHGGGFLNHMGRLLNRLEMTNSTYAAPYPGRNGGNFARGWNGTAVTAIYAYPEMAAASLVATPVDIAKFVIAVNRISQDSATITPLPWAMVQKYLGRDGTLYGDRDYPTCSDPTVGNRRWGLGVRRSANDNGWGGNEIFEHGGLHNGYRTQMIGLPRINSGIVVFMTGTEPLSDGDPTTSDPLKADLFFGELRRAVVAAYGL